MALNEKAEILGVSTVIYRYAPAACLRVTGEDALAFLHGQFTQDLRAAPVSYGLWLNQKGRVLADSFAIRVGVAEVWLLSHAVPAAVLRERLEAYIIADDVMIEDVTSGWRGVAILGEGAGAWIAARAGSSPKPGEFVRVGEGVIFRGRRGWGECWEWLAPGEGPAVEGLSELTAPEMEYRRIVAGVPSIPADVGPGDLPNEAGLEADAISYTKGCYLGQEVMARLKSMGQVRRRLLRVTGPAGDLPVLPAPLYQAGKKMGELRSIARAPDGGSVGLAMLSLLGLDAGSPLALAPDGPAVFSLADTP